MSSQFLPISYWQENILQNGAPSFLPVGNSRAADVQLPWRPLRWLEGKAKSRGDEPLVNPDVGSADTKGRELGVPVRITAKYGTRAEVIALTGRGL